MWVWEVVWVVIPLAAIMGGIFNRWHKTNATVALAQAGNTAAMQELRDVVSRLESRVSNLERAVMTAEEHRKYAL
jgi:3,4-dihydroxy-2-butanone 4-phosphate synthase